jgi:hypothetical protein
MEWNTTVETQKDIKEHLYNSKRYKRTFVFYCMFQVQVAGPIYIIGLKTKKHKK